MKQKKVILVSEEFPLNCLSKLHFLSKSVQTAHSVGMSWYLCTWSACSKLCESIFRMRFGVVRSVLSHRVKVRSRSWAADTERSCGLYLCGRDGGEDRNLIIWATWHSAGKFSWCSHNRSADRARAQGPGNLTLENVWFLSDGVMWRSVRNHVMLQWWEISDFFTFFFNLLLSVFFTFTLCPLVFNVLFLLSFTFFLVFFISFTFLVFTFSVFFTFFF